MDLNKENVIKSSIDYFNGDELAAMTWYQKYCLKKLEIDGVEIPLESSPEEMHHRLAREFARIESNYPNPLSEDCIFNLIDKFKYLVPQGGSMSGVGNEGSIQSLSNCFVVGNEVRCDSYGGIMKIDEEIVQLEKRRGGVGTSLSDLRPTGTKVTNSAKTSSGLASFMERFSNSTREVSQMGRRGALMLTVSINHPDVEAFIDAKLDNTKVTGANCSVQITDEFMKTVKNNTLFLQRFPVDCSDIDLGISSEKCYEINKLYPGKLEGSYFKYIESSHLWNKLIHNAWKSAEPGCLFWDTIITESPADCYSKFGFKTVSTNPCAELPLCIYDSCRLLSINLYSYVENPFTSDARFNFELFKDHVMKAQRLMDDLIDLEVEKIEGIISKIKSDPEPDSIKSVELNLWKNILDKALSGRRTGLGVTGEGDMLAALGLTYASNKAITFCTEVHKSLAVYAYISSMILAEERGAFPIFDSTLESNHPFLKRIFNEIRNMNEFGYLVNNFELKGRRRNISLLTIAPTGTTSIMTQTTSGIEPAFMIYYKRRRKTSNKSLAIFIDKKGDMFEEYKVFHHKFIEWYGISNKIDYKTALEVLRNSSEDDIKRFIKDSPFNNSTSDKIDWVSKVKMQGAIQKWVDHSISCTVNLPKDVTESEVGAIYHTAWTSKCKGITVYRDGCRDGILIGGQVQYKKKIRPDILDAKVVRFINGKENWIAFIGTLNGRPYELFTGKIDDDIKHLPKSITEGKIIKVIEVEGDGARRYDFQYNIGYGYVNTLPGINMAFNPEYFNYARFVSAFLREEVDLLKIISTLNSLKCGDTLNAWNKGVARALKSFIQDGTKSGQSCEYCGAELVFTDGCTHCPSCGKGGKCD